MSVSQSTFRSVKTRGLLTWRWAAPTPIFVAIIAIGLALPALWVGWVGDDHVHRLVMTNPAQAGDLGIHNTDTPGGLFTFYGGDSDRIFNSMDTGIVPWWTYEKLKSSFLRPVSWLTHRLDYRLWPDSPSLMHAQSLLWYALTVMAAAFFFRGVMGAGWVAGIAALLYAVDDAHAIPAGWMANRNALIATFFGLLALIAHDRWRGHGRRGGAIVGPPLLALSLLAGEAGVATVAYLFAYAVFLDRRGAPKGLVSIIPYAVVTFGWRITWQAMGYGAEGGGLFYVDPGQTPFQFLWAMVERGPLLLLGQWAFPPSDIATFLQPTHAKIIWWVSVAFLTLLGISLAPLIRRDRSARFWATGMVLALVPPCATLPSDRNLLFVGVGAMGLLAGYLQSVGVLLPNTSERASNTYVGRLPRVLATVLVVIHLVVGPLSLFARSFMPLGPPHMTRQLHVGNALPKSLEAESVIIVNTPSVLHAGYLPILRAINGEPVPRHTRVLGSSLAGLVLHRTDARTLVARPEGGYLKTHVDRLFRSDDVPLRRGQKIELTGMTVEVTQLTDDGRPAEAVFRFEKELEDKSLIWLEWKAGRYVRFVPPAVGETLTLSAPIPSLF